MKNWKNGFKFLIFHLDEKKIMTYSVHAQYVKQKGMIKKSLQDSSFIVTLDAKEGQVVVTTEDTKSEDPDPWGCHPGIPGRSASPTGLPKPNRAWARPGIPQTNHWTFLHHIPN